MITATITTYSKARENFAAFLEKVEANEIVVVTWQGHEDSAIIKWKELQILLESKQQNILKIPRKTAEQARIEQGTQPLTLELIKENRNNPIMKGSFDGFDEWLREQKTLQIKYQLDRELQSDELFSDD